MSKKIKTGIVKKREKFNLTGKNIKFGEKIISDMPQISLDGCSHTVIEGDFAIVEYEDSVIKIGHKLGCITFYGEKFNISAFFENRISFNGKINSIEFQN